MRETLIFRTLVIWDETKGETRDGAIAQTFRAIADGMDEGRSQGGAPNGGHWHVDDRTKGQKHA